MLYFLVDIYISTQILSFLTGLVQFLGGSMEPTKHFRILGQKTEQNEGGCVGGGREWVSEGCAMGCLSVLALGSVFPMNVGEGNVCTRG